MRMEFQGIRTTRSRRAGKGQDTKLLSGIAGKQKLAAWKEKPRPFLERGIKQGWGTHVNLNGRISRNGIDRMTDIELYVLSNCLNT